MNLLNFITNIKFFLLYKKNYFQQQIAYLFNSSLQIILNNFLWYNLLYIMIFERKIFCFPIRSDHVWVPRADFFFFFLIAMRSRRKKMTLPFRKRSINPRDLLANLCAPFNYRGALPPLLLRVNWVVASIIRTSEYRPYRWGIHRINLRLGAGISVNSIIRNLQPLHRMLGRQLNFTTSWNRDWKKRGFTPRHLNARRGVFGYYAVYFVRAVQYSHREIFSIFPFFFLVFDNRLFRCMYILIVEKHTLIMTRIEEIIIIQMCWKKNVIEF